MTSLLEFTWLDWMHPSWRDMVIDYLIDNKEERQNFLRRCGVQGLLLALSTGGGKKGLRKFPLLIEPEDWAICAESLSNLIKSGSTLDVRSLLKAILDLFRTDDATARKTLSAKPPASELVQRGLKACREKWATDGWAVQPADLRSYYQISEFLSPLPPSPDLREMWQRHLDGARAQIETFDEDDSELLMADINDWLDLCIIVRHYEPRFARQVGLPDKYESEVREFLPSVDSRASWAPDFGSVDECDNEIEQQGLIEEIMTKVGTVFPNLNKLASDIAATAEDTAEAVGTRKARLEETVEDDSRDYVSEGEEIRENGSLDDGASENRGKIVFLTTPPKANLSIEELFEDL